MKYASNYMNIFYFKVVMSDKVVIEFTIAFDVSKLKSLLKKLNKLIQMRIGIRNSI